jgi:SAM-dependent methyltransferase
MKDMSPLLDILINPTYLIRKSLKKIIQEFSGRLNGKVLDAGCGTKPYENFFQHAEEYVGMEYDDSSKKHPNKPDVFYDGKTFPFPDNHFDSVISTEVLEHVFNPNEFLLEVHRVMKSGGLLLLTTPLMWKEHQQPHDYGRYSSFGLRHLISKHGFEILEQRKLVTGVLAVSLIGTRYLKECVTAKNYYMRVILFALFIAPWTILSIVLSKILPNKESTYIGNVVLAKKV